MGFLKNTAHGIAIFAPLFVVSCSAFSGTKEKQSAFEIRRDTAIEKYALGDVGMAANMARKALELEPNDWTALSVLGMSLSRIGAAATDVRQTLPALNESIEVFERAEVNGGADRWQIQFGHGTARTQRARLMMTLVEEGGRRLVALEANAKRPGGNFGSEDYKKTRAKLEAETQQYKSTAETDLRIAENRLEASLKKDPNYLETYEHLQAVFALKNDAAESIEWGTKAMTLLDSERIAREQALQNPNLSIEAAQRLRADLKRFDAKEANCRSLLALMNARAEHYEAALHDLNRVIILDPARSGEFYNRGVCRQKLGKHADAIRDFETFIRKGGEPADSPIVRDAWDRIAACRNALDGSGGAAVAR